MRGGFRKLTDHLISKFKDHDVQDDPSNLRCAAAVPGSGSSVSRRFTDGDLVGRERAERGPFLHRTLEARSRNFETPNACMSLPHRHGRFVHSK
jgi:hypothetical protein